MPYIYTYLDGARNDVEMGPYETEEECEKHRKKHSSSGAMTMATKWVEKEYKPYKPNYDLDNKALNLT